MLFGYTASGNLTCFLAFWIHCIWKHCMLPCFFSALSLETMYATFLMGTMSLKNHNSHFLCGYIVPGNHDCFLSLWVQRAWQPLTLSKLEGRGLPIQILLSTNHHGNEIERDSYCRKKGRKRGLKKEGKLLHKTHSNTPI